MTGIGGHGLEASSRKFGEFTHENDWRIKGLGNQIKTDGTACQRSVGVLACGFCLRFEIVTSERNLADLQTQLQELKTSTQAKLAEMRGEHSKELQELRVAVLGKKGSLTDLLKWLKDLPNEERPKVGKMVNEVRDVLTEAFDEAAKVVEAAKIQAQLDSESLDVTLPGRQVKLGNRHILSQTAEEIEDIFLGMGFQIVDGFEVETDYYNFERMNLPKDHPARDMQDTFYITEEILLRTHTSPVQARTLDKHDFFQRST